MHRSPWITTLFCVLFGTSLIFAMETDSTEFEPKFKPTVTIAPTTSSIKIDGQLTDAGWKDATMATGFSEIEPGDNIAPLVQTEVLITYDHANLYVAFRAYDDPEDIRVTLQDRDNMFSDDFVGIFLDTYGTQTWAYEFHSNPLGIQGDGRMTQIREDMSFDVVYHTEGMVTEDGYQVEFAIPFRSLRFPEKKNPVWRITFFRNHPRESRHQYSLAAVDRDNPCLLCQLGYLRGIEGISPGRNLELLPEAIVTQEGYLDDNEDPNSHFINKSVDAEASLGLKYSLSSNSTIDVTVNPDFSQVEADPAQIDVNTTFALFYPERRPFFQEGSDLFESWMDLVYTRSINDPSLAAKLTGRFDQTSVAWIGGRDEHSAIILPFEEQSKYVGGEDRIRSTSNILRVKRTFAEESHVGLLATDRRFDPGGSESVVSGDFNHRFLKNYRIQTQLTISQTQEPNDTSLTSDIDDIQFGDKNYSVAFDGESFTGHAIYASFERHARLWDFDLNYRDYSPTFRAGNGFITQNNRRFIGGWTDWEKYLNIAWVDRIEGGFNTAYIQNYDGIAKDQWFVPYFNATLTKQTHFNISYVMSRERFQDIVFSGIRRVNINVNSNFSQAMTAGFYVGTGRSIARNEEPPVLGKQFDVSFWSTIKPTQHLTIQPEVDYSQMKHPVTDSTLYDGYIVRARFNYQFTRELFLRLFVQYDDFDNNIDFDPMLTYRINAFSVIYLGTTHDYHDFGTSADYVRTSRQYFLKFRYLFQL
ncbi:MAG: carbohydrate binding family 9 domain-containing protein [Candidatus Marinimicrobia bacterium]|nr:carbohydrate binding family 9 domain-containing protein [Candidatus Neomarinimicrobiota bacterium]MCF7829476.1 carbohydrate binding family 9 domain-containing protein [Candidatus Neomarinimicrobiota bacterium]MCF7880126.1 carbohydrate binding family 9 domain-containing protein [Candidatus Neomarinimicrobiota bacterium]